MYFDGEESSTHKEAKDKLFDLITHKRITIFDQHGNEYKLFNGEHKNEFLHMESFVMDYSNEVIFSNEKSPCGKHFEEYGKKNPHCSMEGYYGAFKELPCEKCVYQNFGKYMENSSKFASYRPDVSFGYEGVHKIWLEIKKENPCSKNKIEFCKRKGIALLEVDAKSVLNSNDYNSKLIFEKLDEYIHKINFYDEIENVIMFVKDKLLESNFIFKDEVWAERDKRLPESALGDIRKLKKFLDRMREEFIFISVEGKDLKKHFGLKRKSSVIVSKKEHVILVNKKLVPDTKAEMEIAFKEIYQIICDKGYIKMHDIKKIIEQSLTEKNKTSVDTKVFYEHYKLSSIQLGHVKERYKIGKLIEMGYLTSHKKLGVIVTKREYVL